MPHTFICRNFRGTDREENERQVEKRENDSQVTHRKNRTLVRQCFLCLCLTSSLFVLIPLFRLTRLFLSFLVINRAWREEGRERSREDRYPGYIKCLQGERRRREGKEKRVRRRDEETRQVRTTCCWEERLFSRSWVWLRNKIPNSSRLEHLTRSFFSLNCFFLPPSPLSDDQDGDFVAERHEGLLLE